MSLISGSDLSQVVQDFIRRDVKLCHACQLKDFQSYLRIGGIPSRNLLVSKGLPYTVFDTDAGDQRKGVWDRVFFNFSDFGYWFSVGKGNLPNPYGPILLCFEPEVLQCANDILVTLWSAGAANFDREADGISAQDIPRLFKDPDSKYVLFDKILREEFGDPRAKSPEMSCSFDEEFAAMEHLAYIRVDPYEAEESHLADLVRQATAPYGMSSRVYERSCAEDRASRYRTLWDIISQGNPNTDDILAIIAEDPRLSTWAQSIRQKDLTYQFERYAGYLFNGTIRECLS